MNKNQMITSFAAVLLGAAFSLGVSWAAMASTSDSQVSAGNSKLTCSLSVSDQNDKVVVTWTIAGAVSARIEPLIFNDGKVPLSGSQTVENEGALHVILTAKDADGHTVRCHAGFGGNVSFAHGSGGTGSPYKLATSTTSYRPQGA